MKRTRRYLISFLASSLGVLLVLGACTRTASEPEVDQQPLVEVRAITRTEELKAMQAVAAHDKRERVLAAAPKGAGHAYPALVRHPVEAVDRENYAHYDDNPVHRAAETPVSTFGMDVDTGSYANIRRLLNAGRLPPEDAVRVEEMVNYFDYDYSPARKTEVPFAVHTTLSQAPWDERKGLLRIGIKGYEIQASERPAANLVFLVDVSGSMQSPGKLDLLKQGLGLLSRQLHADDRVTLVVYAGASGVVLHPTPGDQGATIRAALAQLAAGGSTNGAAGIRLAYDMARQAFIEDGINRVILATDGDFNVGTVNFEQLIDMVERERDSGITLTTLGFGSGNYNDHLMEQLANKGNGNYAYIDTIREANKVLVQEMSSTLQVIAKDVKAQIEFNPAVVAEYRLVGYENRMLEREDFNNDKVDAGDIGAGHTVTALYEIVYADSNAQRIDPLRYAGVTDEATSSDELAFLKLRYKLPDEEKSRLIETPVGRDIETRLADTDADFRFATAVAAFGQQLRGGKYLSEFDYAAILRLARAARGEDRHGYRGEFVSLVELAANLDRRVAEVEE